MVSDFKTEHGLTEGVGVKSEKEGAHAESWGKPKGRRKSSEKLFEDVL